jgi:hypothetical protein
MRKIITTIFAVTLLLGVTSCNDFLEVTPEDRYSEKVVWESKENVKLYLNGFYAIARDYGGFGSRSLGSEDRLSDGLSDILKYSSSVPGTGTTNYIALIPGQISPDQNALNVWNNAYERIRRINEFLDGIEKYGDKFSREEKNQFKAEARFFRGYLYFLLTRNHGSVILLDELSSERGHSRSPEEECWQFVADDFDFAAEYLPATWPDGDQGRVTKGAAYAFKSRAMLYAQRWEDAATAAQNVIDMNQYELSENYADIFMNADNPEVIFAVRYDAPDFSHNFDAQYAPSGDIEGEGGQAGPTQELVDAYEMADGSSFDWNNPDHANNPYQNREPRFYASILYNGANWKGRTIESYVGGKDGYAEYGSSPNPATTVTGYYMRKFLDEDNTDFVNNESDQPWIELRYGEVLLNYAEAKIQQGEISEGMAKVNLIRDRVGLPAESASSKEEAMEIFRHEKMIEMAFEGHRYWDLRRWRLAHQTLDETRMHGMKITQGSGESFNFNIVECDDRDRYFAERYYQFPIPSSEIANNPEIEQIENW